MTCKERFLKYISVYTTSDDSSAESPSTVRQLELSRCLAEEMLSLDLKNVHIDNCGNVIGTLSATSGTESDGTLALISHIDTSPDADGENVRPREVLYTGEDIELCPGVVLSEKIFPFMENVRGQKLLVTDGTTLLGADDKAGVAEIMTAVEKLIKSGGAHGEVRVVFTTDEEIGRGTDGLDVNELACDWGYTVDGGELGVYEYENFNAAAAVVRVHGVGIHPGSAKNVMKNAATIAMELHGLLPKDQVPEKTDSYDGFIHLTGMTGDVAEAELHYIIRDHDRKLFEAKKALIIAAADEINKRYGDGTAEALVSDSYYNMAEKIEPHRHLLTRAEDAYRSCGVTPRAEAIRGGTDGARLSWMGLPCPNLSTGGYNYHGVYEFIPTDSLEIMSDVLVSLVKSFVK